MKTLTANLMKLTNAAQTLGIGQAALMQFVLRGIATAKNGNVKLATIRHGGGTYTTPGRLIAFVLNASPPMPGRKFIPTETTAKRIRGLVEKLPLDVDEREFALAEIDLLELGVDTRKGLMRI